ncbi:periplasmic binding protein-like I [Rozella allomycis CSF55]|uniref:Periplasmic binding protein-like I n=1 Tax=Rozella allomycis (strain CSF55) TaxID=988480 RepID=A0A4P9YIT4_ROZAC|nr:periplasmic binding protein-like I [Rozella allomycis CSF55]
MRPFHYFLLLATVYADLIIQSDYSVCKKCVRRENMKFAWIIHDNPITSPFWASAQTGWTAAKNSFTGINGVVISATNGVNAVQQAQNIENAAASGQYSSLSSTIYDLANVGAAINRTTRKGVKVFTFNSGDQFAASVGSSLHIGQIEFNSGYKAGKYFASLGKNKTMCIKGQYGNAGLNSRCLGFKTAVLEAGMDYQVEDVAETGDNNLIYAKMVQLLSNYSQTDCIFLSSQHLTPTRNAIRYLNLNISNIGLGVVNVNLDISNQIYNNNLTLVIDQQEYLQGYFPFLMQYLSYLNQSIVDTYLFTGPALYNRNNIGKVRCILSGNCTLTRSNDPIHVVIHGNPQVDAYWKMLVNGANQAAKDFGVDIVLHNITLYDTFQLQTLLDSISSAMGVVTTIPNLSALQTSLSSMNSRNITIISVATGSNASSSLGFVKTHIGTNDYDVGFKIANELMDKGVMKGLCLNHQLGQDTTIERCNGFENAFILRNRSVYISGSNNYLLVTARNADQLSLDVTNTLVGDPAITGIFFQSIIVGEALLTLSSYSSVMNEILEAFVVNFILFYLFKLLAHRIVLAMGFVMMMARVHLQVIQIVLQRFGCYQLGSA